MSAVSKIIDYNCKVSDFNGPHLEKAAALKRSLNTLINARVKHIENIREYLSKTPDREILKEVAEIDKAIQRDKKLLGAIVAYANAYYDD